MLKYENDVLHKDVKNNSIIMNHIWAANGQCMSEPTGKILCM